MSVFVWIAPLFLISHCSGIRQSNELFEKGSEQLIFSDEFEYEGHPDSTKWSYDVGDACDKPAGCGWGNNELQYYTEKRLDNAQVKNGVLTIQAMEENYGESQFTSARLLAKNAGTKHGKVEVRAKLPSAVGTWAAIWMLPDSDHYGGWPNSGEIDIMEFVGYCNDTIFGTIHTEAFNHLKGTQKGGSIFIDNLTDEFHTYSLEWGPESMYWYVDNVRYFTFKKEGDNSAVWPFDQKFHLILNLAIGGNWGGKHGIDKKAFPQKFVIDYVRIYTQNVS